MANKFKDYTLGDYQKLIKQLVNERGFDKESLQEVFALLVEEVGEVSKAIRLQNGQMYSASSKLRDVEEELADVFWLVIDLANRLNFDLSEAFYNKEIKNQAKVYKKLK